MFSPSADPMTRDEKRAGASLAAIFALRMLGLFLILPVFAVHAQGIPGGNDLTLVGIAIGAYGLTQSMLQIAFGAASARRFLNGRLFALLNASRAFTRVLVAGRTTSVRSYK